MTPDDVVERLAESLPRAHLPPDPETAAKRRRNPLRGDYQLDRALPPAADLRQAAVLVPLAAYDDGLKVVLTQRTHRLPRHGGQIAFPGGRVDPTDRDSVHTALRETFEEIGIGPDQISVVGRLDDYATGTGFVIAPVVALLEPPLDFIAEPGEVAEIFEVPLGFILNPDNHRRDSREFRGVMRHFWAMPWEDDGGREWYIWGATAAMLVNLYEMLSGA